jgi:transposase-like protein
VHRIVAIPFPTPDEAVALKRCQRFHAAFYFCTGRFYSCRPITNPATRFIVSVGGARGYVWADGVFLQARMEDRGECMLVLIGATPEGKKELIGFRVGVRERAQSWRELLIDVKQRGLQIAPEIAVGDGALGFWKALDEIFPGTRHQRCWAHKTVNVLDKVPLSVQANMKTDLREVYWAPNRASAKAAIDAFAEKCRAKYSRAVECVTKDRDAPLAFYDSLPSIGITCARRTPSKACSRPCGTGRCEPRARCRQPPPS